MVIHENGHKGERDRVKFLAYYRHLASNFMFIPIKEGELAKLSNHALERLCRATWDKQPAKEQRWYAEKHGMRLRSGEFKWRWFWRDLFHPIKRPKPTVAVKKAASELVDGAIPFMNAHGIRS